MRVLIATPSYPRFEGDFHGRFIHDVCCRLTDMGIEIAVLAPRTRSLRTFHPGFRVKRFPFLPSQRMELLPERTMKDAPLNHLIQLPPYLTSAYLHITAEETDIIHSHLAIPMGFLATFTPRHTPLIVTCHGSDCTLPFTKPFYRPFIRHTLRKTGRIVAVSNFIKRLAVRLGAPAERVEVIYQGIDTSKFRPSREKESLREKMGIPSDLLVVGTLGRLVPEKRVDDIIRAAASVSEKVDAHFVVGGDGPHRPYLENLAARLGVRNISFLGEVADAARFHQVCDVFILASVREGLSTALQEAMATGCVPVAVNGFGCPELVREGENGYIFEPRDVEGLAEKTLQAASNPGLGRRARETIREGFEIEKNVMKYVELYRELLSDF
ncbi:MAG: glycosyltransferase family 4 protein [Candidatus Bathyarchaeota archaeon]|nr:glycosyltransferase family 4 protein [Candidatus Bathyarchaeota archaeon]